MKTVKLESIAEIIAGQSPPSDTYNKDGDGLPFFQGKADFGETFPIARYWCKTPTKIALPEDILMSVRAPVGPVNICNLESCIGRGLSAIRVNKKNSNKYIYYFLKVHEKQIEKLGVGSTFKAITQKEIKALNIPIPEKLEDQIRIATILSKVETLIKQRKESIVLLDEFLKSTFIKRFIDKNYPLVKLETITTKITDGEHKKPDYKEEGKPFISVVNISKGFLNFENCKFVSEEDHLKFNKRCNPEFEDIIYTKVGATYGRAIVVNVTTPFSLYVSVALIKPDRNQVNPYFLKAAINHPFVKRQADKSIKGAGVPDLHLIEIKSFKIPLPPIELQVEFAELVQKTEALKAKYQESLKELEGLFGSLSQKAFKGELDLSNYKIKNGYVFGEKESEIVMSAEPEVEYLKRK